MAGRGPGAPGPEQGRLYKPGSGSHHDDMGPGNPEAKQQLILPPSSSTGELRARAARADSDLPGGRQGAVPDILLVSRPRAQGP